MCKEVDSLLENLQNSWQALHQHSQACSVLGLSSDNSPCTLDAPTTITKTATALQQPQHAAAQHQQWHPPYAQQGVQAAATRMGLSHSTQTAEHQQHLLPGALGPATDQNDASFSVTQEWSVRSMLWGCEGWLLGLHRIWEHLMHDTQVVSPNCFCSCALSKAHTATAVTKTASVGRRQGHAVCIPVVVCIIHRAQNASPDGV